MNKNQMRRIVLAANASYLLSGAQTDCVTDNLTVTERVKYHQVQNEIAYGWLKRAGFTPNDDLSSTGIIKKVLEGK